MPILAPEALLRENQKVQWKILPPVGIEPGPLITSDSKSNTILSGLTWHVLLGRSLNFCSHTTWFLDIDDSVRINRAWLYKDPKVSVFQANVNLLQKGECCTWNQRLWEAWVLFQLGVTLFTRFLFAHSKASGVNTGIIAIPVHFKKLY